MRLSNVLASVAVLGGLALSSTAEASKFAYPYHNPDLDWYSIETEHFVVHYPVSKVSREDGNDHYINAEYSARKTADVSEEMWPLMCAELNYFLKERVHVVIVDQPDRLTGFTVPDWDWVEISANPGGYFYRMRGRGEWFSDVMIHEFAHVVSLKASNTISEGAQGVLLGGLYSDGIRDTESGVQFFVLQNDPWWWTEGGAEFWSDNTGYYVWTTPRDANIRMTVLQDRLLTYDEWVTRVDASDWGDGERGYQQGFSMALYLRERFGDETMARMAVEYGKGWRPNWETVIEDVLGVDGRTLYDDWKAYITAKYEAQRDELIADGLVEGYEINGPGEWQLSDRDAQETFLAKDRKDRERAQHSTGTWDIEPRMSDDGKWYGVNSRARLGIKQTGEDGLWAFSGGSNTSEASQKTREMSTSIRVEFMHGWDFVPGEDAVVVTASEHYYPNTKWEYWTGIRAETDGYDWKMLFEIPLEAKEVKEKGRTHDSLRSKTTLGRERQPLDPKPIPNTFRGTDPAVSPDGKRIAFLQYEDGGLNVAIIDRNGDNKKLITNFDDGTMFQHVDWSPDGTQVVVSMYRNYQNDIIVIDVDGDNAITPVTWDGAESFDPHWARDGKIYFTSDPDGMMNVYSFDPTSKEILKITNVLGMAECPYITPDGDLLFSMYTGFGWKTYGLPQEQFLNRPATHMFVVEPDMGLVNASIAYREDLSIYGDMTKKYRWSKAVMPPSGIPLFRMSNDSMTNWGLTGGAQFFAQDFLENHYILAGAELGEDSSVYGFYENKVLKPELGLFVRSGMAKFDFARALDNDGDPTTTNDIEIYEGKQSQTYSVVSGTAAYDWNRLFSTTLSVFGVTYAFRTTADPSPEPFMNSGRVSLRGDWNSIAGYRGWYAGPNPVGRAVNFTYSRGFSDIVYDQYYGVDVDDGEQLDKYQYNQYEFRWTEHWAIRPPWGWDPLGLFGLASQHSHRITADVQAGFIDRNVQANDEFRAGGRHPYFWGSGAVTPNTFFAGYPGQSLSGETMLIGNLAYRFPIVTDMNKKIGPLYVFDLHGQIMGTAGNMWSYRPPDDPDKYYTNRFDARVAYDERDIRREIPFVDYSYKNSPVDEKGKVDPNYLLTDIGAELRLSSTLFNRASWNSFVRVAYGFNEIRGVGDVNGDDIISTADNGLGDSLSNETEAPGVRVYLGLGTGW